MAEAVRHKVEHRRADGGLPSPTAPTTTGPHPHTAPGTRTKTAQWWYYRPASDPLNTFTPSSTAVTGFFHSR